MIDEASYERYEPNLADPEDTAGVRFWTQQELTRIGQVLNAHAISNSGFINDRMRWLNVWEPGTYERNDTVYDQGWAMVANKQTTDRAAPQPVGEQKYLMDDTDPGWTVQTPLSTFVASGHKYVFGIVGYFSGFKVYLPETGADVYYRIAVTTTFPNGDEITEQTPEFQADAVGWTEIPTSTVLVGIGTIIEVVLTHENRASTITVNANYNYTSSNQDVVPGAGESHRRNNRTWVRFHKEDADTNPDPLAGVVAGTIIEVAGESSWLVETVTDAGTYYEYEITGTGNPPNGLYTFVFTIPSANVNQPYIENVNYWLTNPLPDGTVEGVLNIGGVVTTTVTDAYGVDILVQEAFVSPDWDLLANSDEFAGGGGSGSVQWGAITGDIDNQADLQAEFINVEGDTWDQGAVQTFPRDPAATDTTDAEMAFVNFFGINALQIQAAQAATPLGVGYLLLTDRQGEATPFVVGSKSDGWRCRNQVFTDPDAILTVAEGDARYAGGGATWGNIIGNIDDQTDLQAEFINVDGDTWAAGAVQTFTQPSSLPSAPTLTMEYADFLGVNGLVIQPSSGTCGYQISCGTVVLGANNSDGWEIANQVNNSANTVMTRGLADGRYVDLTSNQTVNGQKTFDAQTTIGGGLTGGLIVTGSGAGISIDATGVVLARDGFNAFNEKIVAVATPTSGTDAANKDYVDGVAGSAVWGNITGTLSNQTDLQNELNAKAPVSTTVTTNTTQTITASKTFDAQTTIAGGLTGGLIVTGTGAGFSIDATGVVLARDGFNSNNKRIVAVQQGINNTDAVNVQQLNGKANVSHTHDASQTVSGTFAIARIPTGTTSSTVALGNHTHDASQIVSGTLALARIPNLPASQTTSGTFDDDRIPALLNKQMTIGGGTSGGLIVTGTGAGFGIDCKGAFVARDEAGLGYSINAFNKRIVSVATPTVGTDAANKSYVDTAVSDRNLKNITDTNPDSSVLHWLNVVGFEYDDADGVLPDSPKYRPGKHYGVIAQDAEEIMPEAVYESPVDAKYKAFDYDMLVPLLVKEVQQLRTEINELKNAHARY